MHTDPRLPILCVDLVFSYHSEPPGTRRKESNAKQRLFILLAARRRAGLKGIWMTPSDVGFGRRNAVAPGPMERGGRVWGRDRLTAQTESDLHSVYNLQNPPWLGK